VSQPRGYQQAAHDAHRRHQPLREPPAASGPYQTPAGLNTDQLPAGSTISQARCPTPDEKRDGSKHPSAPCSENRKPSLSQSAGPAPARPERRHIAPDKPRQDHQRPRRNRQHHRPNNRERSKRTQPTARTTPTQKTGLNQMLKTPREAPKDRPAMSKPTTYNSNPVKSGEVTETRQTIKRGFRKYHPHQRRQLQNPNSHGHSTD
jgi:hypothetical protein